MSGGSGGPTPRTLPLGRSADCRPCEQHGPLFPALPAVLTRRAQRPGPRRPLLSRAGPGHDQKPLSPPPTPPHPTPVGPAPLGDLPHQTCCPSPSRGPLPLQTRCPRRSRGPPPADLLPRLLSGTPLKLAAPVPVGEPPRPTCCPGPSRELPSDRLSLSLSGSSLFRPAVPTPRSVPFQTHFPLPLSGTPSDPLPQPLSGFPLYSLDCQTRSWNSPHAGPRRPHSAHDLLSWAHAVTAPRSGALTSDRLSPPGPGVAAAASSPTLVPESLFCRLSPGRSLGPVAECWVRPSGASARGLCVASHSLTQNLTAAAAAGRHTDPPAAAAAAVRGAALARGGQSHPTAPSALRPTVSVRPPPAPRPRPHLVSDRLSTDLP